MILGFEGYMNLSRKNDILLSLSLSELIATSIYRERACMNLFKCERSYRMSPLT